MFDLLIWLTYS